MFTSIETSVAARTISSHLDGFWDDIFRHFNEECLLPESMSERLAKSATDSIRKQLCDEYGITVDQYRASQYGIH